MIQSVSRGYSECSALGHYCGDTIETLQPDPRSYFHRWPPAGTRVQAIIRHAAYAGSLLGRMVRQRVARHSVAQIKDWRWRGVCGVDPFNRFLDMTILLTKKLKQHAG